MRTSAALAVLLGISGCESAPHAGLVTTSDSVVPAPAADSLLFNQRVVVVMEATTAALDSLRTTMSVEDFGVVADDMMFYRAGAYEFLEQRGLPVRRLTGRVPLRFVVGDSTRAYDFARATTLDVIVLYDPGREPIAVPPIEIDAATTYFSLPPR